MDAWIQKTGDEREHARLGGDTKDKNQLIFKRVIALCA